MLARELRGEEAQDQVTRVGVAPLGARLELERHLHHDREQLLLGVVPPEVDLVFPVVPETRGVAEQVADSYPVPARRSRGEVPRERVVEAELALFGQEQDACRRELLSDGARLIDRVGGGRSLQLDVGEAVALRLDERAVPDDRQRETWDALCLHRGPDVVVDGVGRDGARQEGGDDQRGDQARRRHGVILAWVTHQLPSRLVRPASARLSAASEETPIPVLVQQLIEGVVCLRRQRVHDCIVLRGGA